MARRFHPAAIAMAGILTGLGLAHQVTAFSEQMPVAQTAQIAALVLAAAQYCDTLPYSLDDAHVFAGRARSNPDTALLLDELMENYQGQYQLALTGGDRDSLCADAASIAVL